MKNVLLGGKNFNFSFCLYSFRKYVSYFSYNKIFVIPEYIMKRPVFLCSVAQLYLEQRSECKQNME